MKEKKLYIYNLICEDASHLGGPMGSEYTEHIFTKPFSDLQKAKNYAVKYSERKYWEDWMKWKKDGKNSWYLDEGSYIFTIERKEVK